MVSFLTKRGEAKAAQELIPWVRQLLPQITTAALLNVTQQAIKLPQLISHSLNYNIIFQSRSFDPTVDLDDEFLNTFPPSGPESGVCVALLSLARGDE